MRVRKVTAGKLDPGPTWTNKKHVFDCTQGAKLCLRLRRKCWGPCFLWAPRARKSTDSGSLFGLPPVWAPHCASQSVRLNSGLSSPMKSAPLPSQKDFRATLKLLLGVQFESFSSSRWGRAIIFRWSILAFSPSVPLVWLEPLICNHAPQSESPVLLSPKGPFRGIGYRGCL